MMLILLQRREGLGRWSNHLHILPDPVLDQRHAEIVSAEYSCQILQSDTIAGYIARKSLSIVYRQLRGATLVYLGAHLYRSLKTRGSRHGGRRSSR